MISSIRSDEITLKIRHPNSFVAAEKRIIDVDAFRMGGRDISSHSGRILELSSNGAKLFLTSKLENGDTIGLTIRVDELNLEVAMAAVISWSGTKGDGNWHVGCSLQSEFPHDVIQKLLDTGYLERRKDERHTISAKARVMCLKRPVQQIDVHLDDYSKGGFLITTESPMQRGDRFILETTCDGSAIQIPGEACWRKTAEAGLSIGCRFLTGSGYDYLPIIPNLG